MNKGITWFFIFASLLAISTLFIFSGGTVQLGFWGLPNWIFLFFFIEVALVVSIYFFTKYYWKAPKED